jgi:hypothetical protein
MTARDLRPCTVQLGSEARTDLVACIRAVDWSVSGGGRVGSLLVSLLSTDEAIAFEASDDLWGKLCYAHRRLGPAAEPAFPFLIEALASGTPQMRVEMLDILLGLAILCPRPLGEAGLEWQMSLGRKLLHARATIAALAGDSDEEVADWAARVSATIDDPAAY